MYRRLNQNDSWFKIGIFEHQKRQYNLAVTIDSFESISDEPPSNFLLMPYKNMMVLKVAGDVSENYLEDGFWSGYVMIEVKNTGLREDPNYTLLGSLEVNTQVKRGN